MRAALYERVSTGIADVLRSRSVEQQNQEGYAAATRLRWTIAGRYPDPGLSASRYARKDREQWDRLRADIRAGRIDVVVMWEPSRGSRELEDWAGFLNDCMANGVRIYITRDDHLYDLSNARDWRELALEGVDSAHEADKISARARRGAAGAANRGDPYGRIPFGYTRRYELDPSHPKGRRPIQYPHPSEAPVVAEVIGRIARGDSITGLIRDLTDRGIFTRAGKPWSGSSIASMILNGVVYIGKRRHNGSALLDGNWPPIVAEDIYWKAVAVLSDPARRTNAERRGGIRPGAARWLLSYIARCGVCSAPLGTVTNRKVPQYRCANSRASHCYAPVEWLDEMATVAVVGFCAASPLYEVLTATENQEAAAARDEAANERERLADFEDQAVAGQISADSFARIAAGIESRISDLEARARELSVPPALRELTSSAESLETRQEEIYARWAAMPLTARREVIRAIFAPELYPANGSPDSPNRFRMPLNPALRR